MPDAVPLELLPLGPGRGDDRLTDKSCVNPPIPAFVPPAETEVEGVEDASPLV